MATSPDGKFCVGCLTNLRLLCNQFAATRGLVDQVSPPAIADPDIGFKGATRENPDVTCPHGFYMSGIRGWGAGPQAKVCISCLSQIQISCTSFGPVPLNLDFDMMSIFEGEQIRFKKSSCDNDSYVSGVQAWVTNKGTKNCVGCLTGAQVVCKKLDKK